MDQEFFDEAVLEAITDQYFALKDTDQRYASKLLLQAWFAQAG